MNSSRLYTRIPQKLRLELEKDPALGGMSLDQLHKKLVELQDEKRFINKVFYLMSTFLIVASLSLIVWSVKWSIDLKTLFICAIFLTISYLLTTYSGKRFRKKVGEIDTLFSLCDAFEDKLKSILDEGVGDESLDRDYVLANLIYQAKAIISFELKVRQALLKYNENELELTLGKLRAARERFEGYYGSLVNIPAFKAFYNPPDKGDIFRYAAANP